MVNNILLFNINEFQIRFTQIFSKSGVPQVNLLGIVGELLKQSWEKY